MIALFSSDKHTPTGFLLSLSVSDVRLFWNDTVECHCALIADRRVATVSRGKDILAVIRNRFNSPKDDWAVSLSLEHSAEMPLCAF